MRKRMALCRVFVILLLGGVAFLITNIVLLWNQTSSQECPKCDCSENSSNRERSMSESPSSESSLRPVLSMSSPESANLGGNRHDNLIRLLNKTRSKQQQNKSDNHQLAVVVPFRNRYEEMLEFVPHIHSFLERQNVKHKIWIINQADTHRCVCVCYVIESHTLVDMCWHCFHTLNVGIHMCD